MNLWILFFLLMASLFQVQAAELKEILPFEKKVLAEAEPLVAKNPLKAYELRLLIAREYYSYGFYPKAVEHYEEALKYHVKVDRSEALVNTVALSLDNKALALKRLDRLKKSPEGKRKELSEWIMTVESNLRGETKIPPKASSLYTWSKDQKIDELIGDHKFEEAFLLVQPENLENQNINLKIRYDLLSASVLKSAPPKLWCEETLKRYPSSITWTMRICRYLKDKRDQKKSSETIESIKRQLEKESPHHLEWAEALENVK